MKNLLNWVWVTTDGQSASLSWNESPFWGLRPDLYYCLTVAGLLMWGALSEDRTGLSFTIAAVLASAVIFWSESRRTRDHVLLSQIRDFPFRRPLRLAGSRWRYSTPPPHGVLFSAFAAATLYLPGVTSRDHHLQGFLLRRTGLLFTVAAGPRQRIE
jgi:hypothetical protein